MMADSIVIIGAGMGGLSTALSLLQRGFPVAGYEDAPELGEVGAGLSVQASTRRAMAGLGLIEALKDEVVTVSSVGRRHYRTGEVINQLVYGEHDWLHDGPASYFVHRADLHTALVDAI